IIEIPLNKFHQADSNKYIYQHDTGRQFHNYLRSSGHHSSSVIDFSLLQGAMAAAITQYEALLKSINADKNYYLKARLINVGGLIPFFPSEKYLEQLEEFGTPIIRDEELWAPNGTTIDSFMEGEMAEDAPPISGYVLSAFVLHICGILPSFGVDELVDIITAASKAATVTRTNLENST
ncbi:hypothetical protein JYT44_03380, partial [Caldithrix abyssi]|nr:hypothetical protein [Caldithrix abyssi]